jgi:hypothetical protein
VAEKETKTEEMTPEQAAKVEEKAEAAYARVHEANAAAVEKMTGEPVWQNRVMEDHESPALGAKSGMMRIRIHGQGYERDCTLKEWEDTFSKQTGKWEIVKTSFVGVGHSDAESIGI